MKDFNHLNKLFENSDNVYEKIFNNISGLINFEYGCINFKNHKDSEYTYGKLKKGLKCLKENLSYKNTVFGEIQIYSKEFTKKDEEIFKTISFIASNLIKDKEITEIMNLQVESLQKGYKDLKKSDEAKTLFISHVSHELRTPLNSIIGFSDILLNEFVGTLNDKQKEYLEDIKNSGLNLLGMINEILDISKIESGTMNITAKDFQISQLINETQNYILPLCKNKNIKIECKFKDFELHNDYSKLQQILLNLLSNSVKFTPINGIITIKASKIKDSAILSVIDTGIGISKKNQNKIFDKFFQAEHNVPNSTGLGLTIVKELTKLLNGTVSVESELKKGSEFTIRIPLNYL